MSWLHATYQRLHFGAIDLLRWRPIHNQFSHHGPRLQQSNIIIGQLSPGEHKFFDFHWQKVYKGHYWRVVLILLLLALFFIRKRNNWSTITEKLYIDRPLEVSCPPSTHPTSTFSSQNLTSNGQSLLSLSSRKGSTLLPRARLATWDLSVSPGIPYLTALRSQFSSPTLISPVSSRLHLVGSRIIRIGAMTKAREAASEPLMQRSPSPWLETAIFFFFWVDLLS